MQPAKLAALAAALVCTAHSLELRNPSSSDLAESLTPQNSFTCVELVTPVNYRRGGEQEVKRRGWKQEVKKMTPLEKNGYLQTLQDCREALQKFRDWTSSDDFDEWAEKLSALNSLPPLMMQDFSPWTPPPPRQENEGARHSRNASSSSIAETLFETCPCTLIDIAYALYLYRSGLLYDFLARRLNVAVEEKCSHRSLMAIDRKMQLMAEELQASLADADVSITQRGTNRIAPRLAQRKRCAAPHLNPGR